MQKLPRVQNNINSKGAEGCNGSLSGAAPSVKTQVTDRLWLLRTV